MAATPERFSVRVPKTAELLASHIRGRIVRKELCEGDALPPESMWIGEFGVSRPTLREAFRILESEGLITVRRGSRGGARVLEPSIDACARYAGLVLQHRGTVLSDVLDARVVVEAPAAGMLAARADREESAATLQRMLDSAAADPPAHFHRFNALVVELTGNQTMILLTAMLERISRAATLDYVARAVDKVEESRLSGRARRSRRKLIALVAGGDAAGAESHWRDYMVDAGRVLTAGAGDEVLLLPV